MVCLFEFAAFCLHSLLQRSSRLGEFCSGGLGLGRRVVVFRGALTDVNLRSATELSAQFVRYAAKDPLCCPSRISTAQYEIRAGLVVPLSVETNKP